MGSVGTSGRVRGVFANRGVAARVRSPRLLAVCFLLGATFLAGCGGGRPASSTTRSATNTTAKPTNAPPRLSGARARKVSAICRHAESVEDQNVIEQFANKGVSIDSPNVDAALNTASHDVSREANSARLLDPALARDMTAEARVLTKAGHAAQLRTDEGALLAVLHQRMILARTSGVPDCAGAQAGSLLAKAPPP
jgi:hypothetical protein